MKQQEENKMQVTKYAVIIQFWKGNLERNETINRFNLLVHPKFELPSQKINDMLPYGAILMKRRDTTEGEVWCVNCQKYLDFNDVFLLLTAFFNDNKIKFIKE